MKHLHIPKDVIKHLEGHIKPLQPKPSDSLESIMYQAGRLQVLEHLRHLHETYNQEETA